MKEIDLKEFDDYSLSEIFNEEELLKFLHSKYGDTLLVSEWFDVEDVRETDIEFPPEFVKYEEYRTYIEPRSGYARHPNPMDPDYDGPIDPSEIEWYYVYGVGFDDLIKYLRYMYEAEDLFFEFFFKSYVYLPHQRQSYINNAIKRNNSPYINRSIYNGHNYYKAYRNLK